MLELLKEFTLTDLICFIADYRKNPDLEFSEDISYSIYEYIRAGKVTLKQIADYIRAN